MRRGLTLLEMILALAILSAVTGTLVSWLVVASSVTTVAGGAAAWEITAMRVLTMIAEDIRNFDDPLPRNARASRDDGRQSDPRVRRDHDDLIIRTRLDAKDALVRYTLDRGALLRGGSSVLEDVAALDISIDEDIRTLSVSMTCSIDQRSVTRRYRLP